MGGRFALFSAVPDVVPDILIPHNAACTNSLLIFGACTRCTGSKSSVQ